MQKYAKIVNQELGLLEVGIGDPEAVWKTVTVEVEPPTEENPHGKHEEQTLHVSDYYESLGMELMEVEQSEDGRYYLPGKAPQKVTTKAELVEFLYRQKCKAAYEGLTIIKGDEQYLFETNQASITMCNSMALAMANQPDDFTVTWKVWQADKPIMLTITKAEFNAIFAFGMTMINTAFAVEGELNAAVQALTAEQLSDKEYIQAFQEDAVIKFSFVPAVYDL